MRWRFLAGGRWDRAGAVFLIGMAIYHVMLQDRGALAWPDEYLYRLQALGGVEALARFDLRAFAATFGAWGARPGETALRMIPATLQLGVEKAVGVPPLSPPALRLVVLPNVIVSLLLSVAFYRVARLFFSGRPSIARLGTLVFSLLVANQVWIRHAVPYDTALLLCLVSLELALRNGTSDASVDVRPVLAGLGLTGLGLFSYPLLFYRWRELGPLLALVPLAAAVAALWLGTRSAGAVDRRRSIAAGIVGGLALSVYPAYYAFHAGVLAAILLGGRRDAAFSLSTGRVRAAYLHGTSLVIVLLGLEALSRLGGASYLGAAVRLSTTITQGSFEEGFSYLAKYCWVVEGYAGAVLFVLACVYLAGLVTRRGTGWGSPAVARCALLFLGLYLVYAFQSTVLHRMTFTGRYLRMYTPMLVIAAVAPLAAIEADRIRRAAVALLGLISVLSFVGFAAEYARQGYPVNALYELGIGFEDVPSDLRVYESNIVPSYNLPVKALTTGARYRTRPDDPRFVLVNFGWFDIEGMAGAPYVPSPGDRLLYRAPHFQCFRSSRFEGYGIARRREFRERAYELRVYEDPARGTLGAGPGERRALTAPASRAVPTRSNGNARSK